MTKNCENCVKNKTLYCPNSYECFSKDDKPYFQDRLMLLEENQKLKSEIKNLVSLVKNCQRKNRKLKNKIKASEKARQEALDLIEKLRFEKWSITGTDIIEVMDILDIDKGDE